MSEDIRVEAVSFGAHYCVAIRVAGQADRLLDGDDGKPLRFSSATAAIRAGRDHLVSPALGLQAAAKTFRTDRNRGLDDERERVFAKLGGAAFRRGRR